MIKRESQHWELGFLTYPKAQSLERIILVKSFIT